MIVWERWRSFPVTNLRHIWSMNNRCSTCQCGQVVDTNRVNWTDRVSTHTAYWINSNTLKMGMYKAMIIAPTMPPTTAIISGSIKDVRASVVASTSAS